MVKRTYIFFFSALCINASDCGCGSVSSMSTESANCELAKQERKATTPAYSNDACPTQFLHKSESSRHCCVTCLLHTRHHSEWMKSGNMSVDMLLGLPALPAWRLEITREKIYNCLVAWISVSRVLGLTGGWIRRWREWGGVLWCAQLWASQI